MAASAALSSQLSIASMKACLARALDGTLVSSTGAMSQFPSFTFAACEDLNWSIAQKIGSQRSVSGEARLARCAEFTTSTA